MALDLATAVVSITGDNAPLHNAIAGAKAATKRGVDAMQARLRKLGDSFARIGKRMTTFVTLPIVGGFAYMTKAASDFEESSTMFDAVFKELSGDARAWSENFAKSAGRSKAAVIEWMGSLQDTFVPLGITRKRSMELSKALVAHAVDVASFKNRLDVDVIHAFNRGLTGEREILKSLGIVILEADVQQEILAQGWAKTTKEITSQMKAEATFNLILARSTDAIGDNARTSGGLANQMKKLKGQWHDIAVDLGTILIPVAKDLVGVLSDVAKWVKGLSPETKEVALGVAAFAAAMGPLVWAIGVFLKLRMVAHIAQMAFGMKAVAASTTQAAVAMNAYAAAAGRAAAVGPIAGAGAGAAAGGAVRAGAGAGFMARLAGKAAAPLLIAYVVGLIGQSVIEWRIRAMTEKRKEISQEGVAKYHARRFARTGLRPGESSLAPKPGTPEAERRSKRDSENLEVIAKSTKKTAKEGGGLS